MTRCLALIPLLFSSTALATTYTFAGEFTLDATCGPLAVGTHSYSVTADFDPALAGEDLGFSNLVFRPLQGSTTINSTTWSCSNSPGMQESAVYIEPGYASSECYGPDLWMVYTVYGDTSDLPGDALAQNLTLGDVTFADVQMVVTPTFDGCGAINTTLTSLTSDAGPPPPPVAPKVAETSGEANDDFEDAFGSRPLDEASPKNRLRPSTVENQLQDVLDVLNAGGCLDSNEGDTVGGLYSPGLNTGTEFGGSSISGLTIDNADRDIGYTTSDGIDVGSAGTDLLSHYNKQGQLLALRSDGGFMAGRWIRVKGTRGVWVSVSGTCDNPVDPIDLLANGWLSGGLPD